MSFQDPQNPGIGGLDELTDSEALLIQNLNSLGDPNADRILFWDDSASSYAYLTVGSNLGISGTTLSLNTTIGAVLTRITKLWVTDIDANQIINTVNAISASGNAATVPITSKNNIVTNNSAATLTITMTTTSATNMQASVVQILDFSGVAQTITWVNTENSTVTAPTTSNGSTTLPLTVGFLYNSLTSKWRCVASS